MDKTMWGNIPIGPDTIVAYRILVRTPKRPLGWIDYDRLTVALATHGRKKKREGR